MSEVQTQNQTQAKEDQSVSRIERLVEMLKDAAKKLEEYDRKFREWGDTFNDVLMILRGDYVTVQAGLEVKPNGEVRVVTIDLPRYFINTADENLEGVPITEFTRDLLRKYTLENLYGLVIRFIEDLSLYTKEVREEVKNLLENADVLIHEIKNVENNHR